MFMLPMKGVKVLYRCLLLIEQYLFVASILLGLRTTTSVNVSTRSTQFAHLIHASNNITVIDQTMMSV